MAAPLPLESHSLRRPPQDRATASGHPLLSPLRSGMTALMPWPPAGSGRPWGWAPESPSGATGPSEVVEAGSPQEGEGGDPRRFSGTTEEERPFGVPDLLSFVPEERGAEATRAPSGALESSAGGAPLPCGVACEEESGPEDPAGAPLAAGSWPEEEQAGEDLEGEVRSAWRAERRRSSERMSAVVLGETLEKDAVGRHPTATDAAAAAAAFPPSAVLFQEEGETSVAAGSELAPPAILSLLRGRSQSASEADRGAPLLASLRPASTESAEVGALSPVASILLPQETRGAADFPEVTNTQVGHEAEEEEEEEEKEEEEEEEESAIILGVQEQGGAGECKVGTPPPKPPRKFTPLGLEEEPSESVWASVPEKWPGETAPCDFWEDLSERAAQASPPGGQVGSPPRETVAPPAPRLMTGRGGGTSIQGAAEAPRPASPDGDVAKAHEFSKPAASSGETQMTVKEGQAETCPSQFSTEGLGLMGARENATLRGDEEPGSSLWTTELVQLPKLGSFQTAKELPWQEGSGARPPCSPQAPHLSPSMMFWTALEEQQPPTPLDYPEAVVQPPGGEEGQPPSLRDGEGATAAGFPTREAPPSAPPPVSGALSGGAAATGPPGGLHQRVGSVMQLARGADAGLQEGGLLAGRKRRGQQPLRERGPDPRQPFCPLGRSPASPLPSEQPLCGEAPRRPSLPGSCPAGLPGGKRAECGGAPGPGGPARPVSRSPLRGAGRRYHCCHRPPPAWPPALGLLHPFPAGSRPPQRVHLPFSRGEPGAQRGPCGPSPLPRSPSARCRGGGCSGLACRDTAGGRRVDAADGQPPPCEAHQQQQQQQHLEARVGEGGAEARGGRPDPHPEHPQEKLKPTTSGSSSSSSRARTLPLRPCSWTKQKPKG
ncbi:hypothetical protein JRQ81_017095, partial [Phrynocephalus forsythii]